MNNLKNLYPCLDSIRKYTSVSYETFVVAYLFSKENLDKLRKDFPWVTIIESNEIRGFSENNNLALRQAKGKYCFVVNDDTEMKMPVIDRLLLSFNKCPNNTAILSPCILNKNGGISVCGVAPYNLYRFIFTNCHLWPKSKDCAYINQHGLFKSYNIIGAAFLIKTDVFREMGWFDEYYFFCPEDIALSTKINKHGYSCYVDADTKIYHYEGMSGKSLSMIQTATKPAATLGEIAFYSSKNNIIALFLRIYLIIILTLKFFYHSLKSLIHHKPNADYILAIGDINCIKACFSSKTPKEIFKHFYLKSKK
ncbi:glycosyltransferase [Prevotella sp.]|uniref:glycosyltransferase n=1 Tax=Prevotella sp. TaxID=59823 RepID=UPI003AB63108